MKNYNNFRAIFCLPNRTNQVYVTSLVALFVEIESRFENRICRYRYNIIFSVNIVYKHAGFCWLLWVLLIVYLFLWKHLLADVLVWICIYHFPKLWVVLLNTFLNNYQVCELWMKKYKRHPVLILRLPARLSELSD